MMNGSVVGPIGRRRRGATPTGATLVSLLLALVFGFGVGSAVGQVADYQPEELEGVGITEHLDETIPLDLVFTADDGREVRLGDYFGRERPVLLTLNYYGCPMLCGLMLNGLVNGLKGLEWTPGEQYEMVTVSINPRETYKLARLKKQNYLKEYGRAQAAEGWHFLVGRQPEITELAEATGFGYRYIEETGEYSHAAVTMVLTPDGRLSRYLYGVVYDPKTIRYSMIEASEGRIGSPLDQILLYCFNYSPSEGRYAPVAMNIMRVGGFLTALVLGLVLLSFWIRDSRKKRALTVGAQP